MYCMRYNVHSLSVVCTLDYRPVVRVLNEM